MNNNDVLINKTDIDNDNTIVYFTVPSLNIDSRLKITNDEFTNQMSIGGFKQLGHYLIEQLEIGLNNLLTDNPVQSQVLTKTVDVNKNNNSADGSTKL